MASPVRVEWGPAGARSLALDCDVVVVCDVLSFSTAVTVGVAHGLGIHPYPWKDASAAAYAEKLHAVVAGRRGAGVSLSPPSLLGLEPGTSVVLPSPNGATCSLVAAESGALVIAGCLRNAPAVARRLEQLGGRIGLLAAGEQWPDGSLRPAYEDWVGVGAIALLLSGDLTPEAAAAAAAAADRRPLSEVASGVELIEMGFADDVTMAEEVGADDVVPVLESGRFGVG